MPLPPNPPPPPGPPPPPNALLPKLNVGKASKTDGDPRGALLESIRSGKTLKKVQCVNDRSAPIIGKTDASSTPSATSSSSAIKSVVNGGPPNLGNLFAHGIPKLKPTKGTKVNLSSQVESSQSYTDIRDSASSSNKVPASSTSNVLSSLVDPGNLPRKQLVQNNVTPRGLPPQPPPAYKKPAAPIICNPSQAICGGAPNNTGNNSQSSNKPRQASTKPNLAPKPSGRPPPPPKSAQIFNSSMSTVSGKPLPAKPVLRTHSMIASKPTEEILNSKLSMRFLSRENVHKNEEANTRQAINLKPAPPPPPPSISRSSSTTIPNRTAPPRPPTSKPPPPPPVKTVALNSNPPPPPPPVQAPPPPPHRTGPVAAPAISKFGVSNPPPPPLRNSSMKLSAPTNLTGQALPGKFEQKYMFLSSNNLPQPDKFNNTLKIYRSRNENGINKRPPAPQPPEYSVQLDSKMFAKNHSVC